MIAKHTRTRLQVGKLMLNSAGKLLKKRALICEHWIVRCICILCLIARKQALEETSFFR